MPQTRNTAPARNPNRNDNRETNRETRQSTRREGEARTTATEQSGTRSHGAATHTNVNHAGSRGMIMDVNQFKTLVQEVADTIMHQRGTTMVPPWGPGGANEQPEPSRRSHRHQSPPGEEAYSQPNRDPSRHKSRDLPPFHASNPKGMEEQRDELSRQLEILNKKVAALSGESSKPPLQKRVSPFSKEIMAESVKGDFRTPPLPKFEGKGDPQEHATAFESTMQLYGWSDAINCRVFITTLTGRAQTWFTQLEAESVHSYEQLSRRFLSNFASNKRCIKGAAHLYRVKQRDGETLRNFMARFNDEKLSVPNLSIDMITNVLIQGLNPGRFLSNLAMDPPGDIDSLMKEAEMCINEEEVFMMKK